MATRTISMSLSTDSIDAAIREIRQYREDFIRKCAELRRRVAERIFWSATNGFSVAITSDFLSGTPPINDVQVTMEDGGDMTVVIASGNEVLFIEFGAGVYYNGAPGDSPHPWGVEHGFGIGTYGKGHGVQNMWVVGSEGGKKIWSRGTPAAMPMYRGAEEAIRSMERIVREVFG